MPLTNGIPPLPRFGTISPSNDDDWQQLYRWLVKVRGTLIDPVIEGNSTVLSNTPASSYVPGTIFLLTDTNPYKNILYVQQNNSWQFVSGVSRGTLAELPTLGLTDAGYQYQVIDYAHLLNWDGTSWSFAPGDPGSGFMQLFEITPSQPGWALYAGQQVYYLQPNGTLATITLPDLVNHPSFLVGGPANTAINPATPITATGSGGSISTATTGVTIPSDTGNDSGSGTVVQSGAGATVASHTHTHPEGPVTDPGHTHTFTAVQPTISGGTPQNIVRRAYFRL